MTPGPVMRVSLEVAQDLYLAADQTEMHAVLRVTAEKIGSADDGTAAIGGSGLAEVLIIDCSGSMGTPGSKFREAKQAVRAALDVLPDGTKFAVVRGDMVAEMVYPVRRKLATLDPSTRRAAHKAVVAAVLGGGTRMGQWLTLARELLVPHTTSVRHALLLTDGQNAHESASELTSVLAACSSRFVCDPRGVGDDWEPAELRRIAAELRGTARAVARPDELTDDFRATIGAVLGKVVPDLRLRISTSGSDRLAYCRQTYPSIAEIAGPRARHHDGPFEISLGAWGDEAREYHLCFTVTPDKRPFEEDLRLARLDVVADGPLATDPAVVLVHWTEDEALSGMGDASVTYATNQQKLASEMNKGYFAYLRGNRAEAENHFGLAVMLATAMGETVKLRGLSMVVRIVDAARGEVELKDNVSITDLKILDLGSVMTESSAMPQPSPSPSPPPAPVPLPAPVTDPDAAPRVCPNPLCGSPVTDPAQGFCHHCGRPLTGSAPDASAPPGATT